MKLMFPKIISGLALATVIALVTQTSTLAQSPQKQQGIEGVWDATITIVRCDTGAAIGTGHAILMFIAGGSLTDITPDSVHSAGLGTWRHLRGPNYTVIDRFFVFNTDGSFSGTQVVTRPDIALIRTDNKYTNTATSEFFNSADQLVSTGCSTVIATRLDQQSD
jgi:hypothetical protein